MAPANFTPANGVVESIAPSAILAGEEHKNASDQVEDVEGAHKPGTEGRKALLESEFVNLTKWQATKVFWKPTLICVLAMTAVLMDGYALTIPGNIVSNPGFIRQFGTVHDPRTGTVSLNAHYVSLWGGLVGVTIFFGQQLGSFICDRYGRIVGRIAFTTVLFGAAFGEMFSREWRGWLASKAILGLGQGLVQATTLPYVAEIAPTQTRGALVAMYGIFLGLGQLVSAIALQVVKQTDQYNWLKAVYSQWVLQGLWFFCIPFLPESPWWHARGGRADKCKKVLLTLNKHVPGYNVEREYASMQEEIAHEEERRRDANASSYREIFTFPNFRRTVAGAMGVAMLQWSGAGVVFSYATYFFQQAGISQPFQCTVIVYTLLVFGTILSTLYFTERFGRRGMVLTGGTACCVCNFIIAGLGSAPKSEKVNNAILAVICIWVMFYAICLAGVGWGISAEMSSPRLRAKTTAFSQNFYQLWGIMLGFVIPLMLASGPGNAGWGVKTLFLFAFLGLFGTITNYFTLPEIRGRTYNEIDEMFEGKVPPRKMKSYRTLVEQEGTKVHR